MKIVRRNNCRGCHSRNIKKFLDLGNMPLAGGFLERDQIKKDKKIRLTVFFCEDCHLVQILDSIDSQTLFEHYFYVSSVIPSLAKHFKDYAAYLQKGYLALPQSTLFEFGCNDGVLLQNFKNSKRINAIGIDPSINVSKIGRSRGLNILTGYFQTKTAEKIRRKYGLFDVVTGSNVFAHIDDIHEIMKAAKILLKPNGVFIVEVHYLGDLMKDYQYDTIYHEHLCYYSVGALQNIFRTEGLRLIDVQHLPMHGGGIRVVATDKNSKLPVKKSVTSFLKKERKNGLYKLKNFLKFSGKSKEHKNKLLKLLTSLKKKGKSIVGYGAAGRAVILLNYCAINGDILDYMVDVSPLRIGKFIPGVHLPIYDVKKLRENPPDYILITAWNYADSIIKQEHSLKKKGVKFIVPFPKIKVI